MHAAYKWSEKVCTDKFCSILFLKTGNVSENDLKLFFFGTKNWKAVNSLPVPHPTVYHKVKTDVL